MSSVVDHGVRLEALDSLRGLAARVVFMSHCVLCLESIPYALYPLHISYLYSLIELLWGRISPFAIFALALVLTFALAEAFFRVVERPSIALGKHLAQRVRDRELVVVPETC